MENHRDVKWFILVFSFVIAINPAFSQSTIVDPLNVISQADYVIITPSRFVPTMQPLADLRRTKNGFSVAIVTTEAIYDIFGQNTTPDSAIRSFVTYTLTGGWAAPAPQYVLLAGGVDAIPSHKEQGLYSPPSVVEDSVFIDQWFVEVAPDTARPGAAIGRFPATDSASLAIMVDKTVAYETSSHASWSGRTLLVADYDSLATVLFENEVQARQSTLAPVWSDTVTVHIRESSPRYKSAQELRSLWDQGVSMVGFVGHCNWMQFSASAYFATWDVDSLSENSPLVFCMLESGQRFERTDTLSIAVSLLQANAKGAVVTLAPCGLVFSGQQQDFFERIFGGMVDDPNRPIGKIILDAKRILIDLHNLRRQTLLGDPALVIKSPQITGVTGPGPSVPAEFVLYQNYPNPFNPVTTIALSIPRKSTVTLKVYDMLGREIETLFSGEVEAGLFTTRWAPTDAASGVYFYRATADGYVETRRMILLR